MKTHHWLVVGGASLAAVGAGLALKSFLPPRFPSFPIPSTGFDTNDTSSFPIIEVSFLRCGSVDIPELIAVRGALSLAPCTIAHSAVLIRHPRATFLYDTGLCTDISLYLAHRSLFFRKTLANFVFEQSLRHQLRQHGLAPSDLSFALLSHLHWDHVSGVPDLPGLPLRVNRVEYEAARYGLFEQEHGLVRDLLGNNPVQLFDCNGPTYVGFRSSYDLFGDGSIVLVPLPGHTAGNTGMFINRSNGCRVFLLGDAVWVAANYQRPTTMHPFIWSRVTSDDATARQTLLQLSSFANQHPDIPLIAMHDAALQEAFTQAEATSHAIPSRRQ
jgi:N-acyl homoserine lactone hydrolase